MGFGYNLFKYIYTEVHITVNVEKNVYKYKYIDTFK